MRSRVGQGTTATSVEQLQGNVGTEEDVAATQPVETGESDTSNEKEPGTEEDQREPEGSGEEAPMLQEQIGLDELEQQPLRPKPRGRQTQNSKQARNHLIPSREVC